MGDRKSKRSESPSECSLRSNRFRGAKSEERGFRCCARAKNGARALHLSPCNSLLPNFPETLATQATVNDDD